MVCRIVKQLRDRISVLKRRLPVCVCFRGGPAVNEAARETCRGLEYNELVGI